METEHQNTPPTEFLPFLRSLLTADRNYPWLAEFYVKSIQEPYTQFIEDTLFDSNKYGKFYPYAVPIDKLRILKSYFTREAVEPFNIREVLRPLKLKIASDTQNDNFAWPAQRVQSNLIWQLQNQLSSAITRNLVPVDTFVSEDAHITLRELIGLQILFYMKRKVHALERSDVSTQTLNDLKKWIEKEIGNRVPKKLDLSPKKLKEQQASLRVSDISNRNMSDSLIYFFNGATRLPICVQLEYIKLSNIANNFKINVEYFANQKWKAKDLYLNLPLASLRFFLDMALLALLPYRVLRTLVNEITSSSFKIIRNLTRNIIPSSAGARIGLASLYYSSQAAFYAFLLLSMGLPLFPNPISWLPQGFLYAVPVIAGGYYLSVMSGGFLYKIFSHNKSKVPDSKSQNLEWLPFKPHPTEHRPEPNLALYDFPKPFRIINAYENWGPFIPKPNFVPDDLKLGPVAPAA
ncbi:MAG: hypothetical protein U1E78_02580 [Gammaproteobacteria bacterium]